LTLKRLDKFQIHAGKRRKGKGTDARAFTGGFEKRCFTPFSAICRQRFPALRRRRIRECRLAEGEGEGGRGEATVHLARKPEIGILNRSKSSLSSKRSPEEFSLRISHIAACRPTCKRNGDWLFVSRFSIMKRPSSRIPAETKMRSLARSRHEKSVGRSVGHGAFSDFSLVLRLSPRRQLVSRNRISGITAGLGRLLSR